MINITSILRAMMVAIIVGIGCMTAGAKTLYLRTTSAADSSVELGEIKSITIGDQTVTILLTDNSKVECAAADFKSIRTTTAGTPGSTAVADITASANEQWQVYDLKGNLLGTADALTLDGKTLSSSLAPGVYIVKSESRTLKLIVR